MLAGIDAVNVMAAYVTITLTASVLASTEKPNSLVLAKHRAAP